VRPSKLDRAVDKTGYRMNLTYGLRTVYNSVFDENRNVVGTQVLPGRSLQPRFQRTQQAHERTRKEVWQEREVLDPQPAPMRDFGQCLGVDPALVALVDPAQKRKDVGHVETEQGVQSVYLVQEYQ